MIMYYFIRLHGHVHESARITSEWKDKLEQTNCFNASHDGEELAMIIFNPEKAEKKLF